MHILYTYATQGKPILQKFHLKVDQQLGLLEKIRNVVYLKLRGGRPSTGDIPLWLTQRHFKTLMLSKGKKRRLLSVYPKCERTYIKGNRNVKNHATNVLSSMLDCA